MARKVDPTLQEFEFKIKFSWEENFGLSKAAKGILWFLFTVAMIGGSGYLTYYLHIKEVIEVPVPKVLRVGCLKGYRSRAEIKAELDEIER